MTVHVAVGVGCGECLLVLADRRVQKVWFVWWSCVTFLEECSSRVSRQELSLEIAGLFVVGLFVVVFRGLPRGSCPGMFGLFGREDMFGLFGRENLRICVIPVEACLS